MKTTHKLYTFILTLFMIGFVTLSFGQTVRVEANEDVVASSDVIINIGDAPIPVSKYGEDVDINIALVNDGKDNAYDVKITPILDSSTDIFPYEIKQMNYERPTVKEIGENGLTLKGTEEEKSRDNRLYRVTPYTFTTRIDAPSGYTKISFLISYRPGEDSPRESVTRDLFVKTTGAPPPTETPHPTEIGRAHV